MQACIGTHTHTLRDRAGMGRWTDMGRQGRSGRREGRREGGEGGRAGGLGRRGIA